MVSVVSPDTTLAVMLWCSKPGEGVHIHSEPCCGAASLAKAFTFTASLAKAARVVSGDTGGVVVVLECGAWNASCECDAYV